VQLSASHVRHLLGQAIHVSSYPLSKYPFEHIQLGLFIRSPLHFVQLTADISHSKHPKAHFSHLPSSSYVPFVHGHSGGSSIRSVAQVKQFSAVFSQEAQCGPHLSHSPFTSFLM
jgi:hypothetical protein